MTTYNEGDRVFLKAPLRLYATTMIMTDDPLTVLESDGQFLLLRHEYEFTSIPAHIDFRHPAEGVRLWKRKINPDDF